MIGPYRDTIPHIDPSALVFRNATVLGAVTVGPAANVWPDGVLVAGNPAVVKRPLTDEERTSLARSAETYVKCSRDYLTFAPRLLYSSEELRRGDEQRHEHNGV